MTQPDPLALIVGAGGACIGALSMIVWSMLLGRVGQIERSIKELTSTLNGATGFEARVTRLEGRTQTLEAEVAALKASTLTREFFKSATEDQNRRLDDLRTTTKEIDGRVQDIDKRTARSMTPPSAPYRK